MTKDTAKQKAETSGLRPEVERIVEQALSPEGAAISTEVGLQAARVMIEQAHAAGVTCALAGGIAMHLYGFTRATKDVDMLAARLLDLPAQRQLSFGGASYRVELPQRTVTVDWIVRDDEQQDVYEAALADARVSREGLPLVTPEWMVLLKKLADRGKDHLDLLWLLRADRLVDRAVVERLARKVFGKYAYLLLQDLGAVYLEADLLKAKDARDEGAR
jgi:hypothetical protein